MDVRNLEELAAYVTRAKDVAHQIHRTHLWVHRERDRLFKWAEALHYTRPMFSSRTPPESPRLPEER